MQLAIVAEDWWARWFLPLCLHMLFYESNVNLRQTLFLCLKSKWQIWISGSSESRAFFSDKHELLHGIWTHPSASLQLLFSVRTRNPRSPSPPWYFRKNWCTEWVSQIHASSPNPLDPEQPWATRVWLGARVFLLLRWDIAESSGTKCHEHSGKNHGNIICILCICFTTVFICNITVRLSMVPKSRTSTSCFSTHHKLWDKLHSSTG